MAPSKGAARRDSSKDREPGQMLLTVALMFNVSDISALPIGEIARMVGNGVSDAIMQPKLTQLIELGRPSFSDHEATNRRSANLGLASPPLSGSSPTSGRNQDATVVTNDSPPRRSRTRRHRDDEDESERDLDNSTLEPTKSRSHKRQKRRHIDKNDKESKKSKLPVPVVHMPQPRSGNEKKAKAQLIASGEPEEPGLKRRDQKSASRKIRSKDRNRRKLRAQRASAEDGSELSFTAVLDRHEADAEANDFNALSRGIEQDPIQLSDYEPPTRATIRTPPPKGNDSVADQASFDNPGTSGGSEADSAEDLLERYIDSSPFSDLLRGSPGAGEVGKRRSAEGGVRTPESRKPMSRSIAEETETQQVKESRGAIIPNSKSRLAQGKKHCSAKHRGQHPNKSKNRKPASHRIYERPLESRSRRWQAPMVLEMSVTPSQAGRVW